MVNLIAAHESVLHWLMKKNSGLIPHTLQIETGTVIHMWAPPSADTLTKPAVVLLHGFAGDGIYTWQFQVRSLTKKYSVYVPDLLFFGGSTTDKPERSVAFQAECVAKALRMLGMERCRVVGFSYGGMVAYKMAELYPELVAALIITGSVPVMTCSMRKRMLEEIGFSSLQDFLMPNTVEGCKTLIRIGAYSRLWLPNLIYKHFLQVMFNNRKERAELLQQLVFSTKETTIPKFHQRIHLLWGEHDQLFKLELAQTIKMQLGEKATIQGIKKAGHLVNLERPCVYNKCLKQFLASLLEDDEATD